MNEILLFSIYKHFQAYKVETWKMLPRRMCLCAISSVRLFCRTCLFCYSVFSAAIHTYKYRWLSCTNIWYTSHKANPLTLLYILHIRIYLYIMRNSSSNKKKILRKKIKKWMYWVLYINPHIYTYIILTRYMECYV